MIFDWSAIGTGIAMAVTGITTWFVQRKSNGAKQAASVAASGSDKAIADAESILYNRLRERLDSLEKDVTNLRSQLDVERKHSRSLEIHVWRLENIMRKANLEPPVFVEASNVA